MNAFGICRVDVIFHLVAADAECLSVCDRHRKVEQSHIGDTGQEEDYRHDPEGKLAPVPYDTPIPGQN